jgi:hypothetical protein
MTKEGRRMATPAMNLLGRFALAVALATSTGACRSDTPLPDDHDGVADQDGGQDASAACAASEKALYTAPGCGAAVPPRVCVVEHACASKACSCNGKIILACYGYDEPFAYRFPNDYATQYFRDVGQDCDPQAPDAGAADAEMR